jgi:hypothetical protein
MLRKELLKRSPIRILEKSIHGGLGKGNIGVFTGRKGVGKTASLVHVAIDQLLREKQILHITFADDTRQIENWYRLVFQEVSTLYKLEHTYDIYDEIKHRRLIINFKRTDILLDQIKTDIDVFIKEMGFKPHLYVVDGYPFDEKTEDDLLQWKQLAEQNDIEIWFSATLHRENMNCDKKGIPAPINRFQDIFSVIIMLEPESSTINLKLLKDHDSQDLEKLQLKLDPRTLLIANSV